MNGWIIVIGLLDLCGLVIFSTLNLALHVPMRSRLAVEFERHGKSEDFEGFVVIRPQYMLATAVLRALFTLVLFGLALVYATSLASWSQTVTWIVAGAASLALVLVFGVAIPNASSKYQGEWMIVHLMPLLSFVRIICYPATAVLGVFDPLVRRLAGVPIRDAKSYADELEKEILNAVSEGERHGAVDEEEAEMIESVMELADTRVEEIMTPRTDIVALPRDAELDTVLDVIRENGHSRVPVYDETIDTVLGVLYAKDLLRRPGEGPFDLVRTMRKVLFVPESKLVRDLLREFQAQKVHIAVVLDEYGGTAGLVTIEDILEELVGDITDEYDAAEPAEFKRIDDRTVEVDARMRIDDLNDQFDIRLPENEDYETIGGFVFSTLGRVPKAGERCEYENVAIQVIAAEPRRILRLRLDIAPAAEGARDGAVL